MLQLIRKSVDIFRNRGIRYDYFKLSNTENIPGFTNIVKIVSSTTSAGASNSADEGEELWMDLLYYKDRNHRDDFVSKMSKDKECQAGYEEFTKLLTPGSQVINGEFSHL